MNAIILIGCYFVIVAILYVIYTFYSTSIKEYASKNKRKLIIFFCIVGLVLILSVIIFYMVRSNYIKTYEELIHTMPTNGTESIFILEYNGAELISNDSVGSDWEHRIKIENQEFNPYSHSETIETYKTINDFINFIIITKEDDNIPDVASFTDKIPIEKMFTDYTFSLNMYVRENRGRYTNNVAHWRYNFKLYRKVESEEVWEYMKNR